MSSILDFLANNGGELLFKTWEHLYISLVAVLMGTIVAIPLGIALTRMQRGADAVMKVVSIIQTFPTLAILAFFVPLFGVGKLPATIALFLYSVLPILRNTYTGVKEVDKDFLEAGRGMGMNGWEIIRNVEIPFAIPIIMAGIRLSTVYLIGWAALASYIGAGGLGSYIFDGLNLYQPEYIIAGSIPAMLMAVVVDQLFAKVENWVTPKGMQEAKKAA